MKFYYTDSKGGFGDVDLGDCPLCTHGVPVNKTVVFSAVGFDGRVKHLSMKADAHERLQNVANTLFWQNNQRRKARKFRYNRMIYQGARHGT